MEWKGNFAALTATEREAIERVILQANAMSNICFNLSQQRAGIHLDNGLIELFGKSYKEFDKRLAELRKVARKSRRRRQIPESGK